MIPWVHIDTAKVPDGYELKLMQRGTEFSIMAGQISLMNNRLTGSEIELARLACERLRGRKNVRMLIGGYGMGFTLRTALAELGPDATVVVSELVPEVIKWARGPMAETTAGCLDDPRVEIRQTDVHSVIASSRGSFDAMLLDVDNGPDGLSRDANDRLYTLRGLHAQRQALRPKGILAIWSASPNKEFAGRLAQTGMAVEEVMVRAHKGKGARHIVWLAKN